MYGFQLEIKDSLKWSEKVVIFDKILSFLNDPALDNKKEIMDTINAELLRSIKRHAQDKTLRNNFDFMNNRTFYKTLCSEDEFLNVIKKIASTTDTKLFVESVSFFIEVIFYTTRNDTNNIPAEMQKYMELFSSYMTKYDILEENIPTNPLDYDILYRISIKDDRHYSLLNFLPKVKDIITLHKTATYSSELTEGTMIKLIEQDILRFNSFTNIATYAGAGMTINDPNIVELIKSNRDMLTTFIKEYIDRKCSLIANRKEIIKFLEEIKHKSYNEALKNSLTDIINDVLLVDSKYTNMIKSEWLSKNISSTNTSSDPFDF